MWVIFHGEEQHRFLSETVPYLSFSSCSQAVNRKYYHFTSVPEYEVVLKPLPLSWQLYSSVLCPSVFTLVELDLNLLIKNGSYLSWSIISLGAIRTCLCKSEAPQSQRLIHILALNWYFCLCSYWPNCKSFWCNCVPLTLHFQVCECWLLICNVCVRLQVLISCLKSKSLIKLRRT